MALASAGPGRHLLIRGFVGTGERAADIESALGTLREQCAEEAIDASELCRERVRGSLSAPTHCRTKLKTAPSTRSKAESP